MLKNVSLCLLSLALLTSGCGKSEAPSTEVTPDLIEKAKVHDQKVQDEEKAHQKQTT
jgi:hypothetical protein